MISVPPKETIKQLELGLEYSELKQELKKLLRRNNFPKALIEKAHEVTVRRLETGYKEAIRQPVAYLKEVLFRLLFENNSIDNEDIKECRIKIKERILLGTFVRDLLNAGYAKNEIYGRLVDVYGEKVSSAVLNEFKSKLK